MNDNEKYIFLTNWKCYMLLSSFSHANILFIFAIFLVLHGSSGSGDSDLSELNFSQADFGVLLSTGVILKNFHLVSRDIWIQLYLLCLIPVFGLFFLILVTFPDFDECPSPNSCINPVSHMTAELKLWISIKNKMEPLCSPLFFIYDNFCRLDLFWWFFRVIAFFFCIIYVEWCLAIFHIERVNWTRIRTIHKFLLILF